MEEIPRPREAPPEPTVRSEPTSAAPTPDTTMSTTIVDEEEDDQINVPEVCNQLLVYCLLFSFF